MLWEADPQRFAQRYPDSGIQESYWGWPQPCIDYWVYVDEPTRLALISTEGWTGGRHEIPLTGRGVEDARRISEVLGAILRVGP